MATFDNGILGGFRGKVGTVVGILQGDQYHMRSLPRKRKERTPGELSNEDKFAMVQAHLKPVKELVRAGFKNYYTKTGGIRGAISYTRKIALVTDDAGSYIDPALFKISGGELAGAVDPTVTFLQSGNVLVFLWNVSQVDQYDGSDQMMALIYDTVNLRAVTRIFDGAFRSSGEMKIAIPTALQGAEVDIYIGFIAADRSGQSDSQYLGRMVV